MEQPFPGLNLEPPSLEVEGGFARTHASTTPNLSTSGNEICGTLHALTSSQSTDWGELSHLNE